ncbi:MAG: hypothetical protein EXS30_11750 [Pedosphaera sp.]|nr:hypothetical protein [Pedosphaera sp.]
MKAHITSVLILSLALAQSAMAQNKPGNPEDNGLTPKTETSYVNSPPDDMNNGKLESLGVSVSSNGNVIVGWEDDGDGITDFEAVWMLLDSVGKRINTDALIKSVDGTSVTTKYRAFFRKDGSPVSGNTAWGPKIKANLFGDGIGLGATAYDLGKEVPELAALQTTPTGDSGDFPAVQLLTNDGKPIAIVSGLSDKDADPDGDVRIGDWEYLANGNVVIVGESRQKDDLVNRWKGAAPGNHAVYRIVDQTGKEVVPLALVGATPDANEIWHGVGVTKNGFAVRFGQGGAKVRMFNNSGVPVSTNIDVGALTGKAIAAGGGRGDGSGFHGNGNDAYVLTNSGTDDQGAKQVWLTVLNTNGTVRFSRAVADDLALTGPDRVDAAIDSSGRVLAVFDDPSASASGNRLVLGRMFDDKGNPLGKTFFVSEKETDGTASADSRNPRAAWRGGLAAVVWQSKNSPDSPDKAVVGVRLFSTFEPGSAESAGLKRVVADTAAINPGVDSLDNWEPYISVLGNSTFLIEANTFADGSTGEQRYVVAFQPADGKPMKRGEGFYTDSGQPFKGSINLSRQNGNPGRVAGDRRPGAVNFMVGAETSVHSLPEFQADKRWTLGFLRATEARFATVEIYKLDAASLAQTPLTKAIDPVNGRLTSGDASGIGQLGRFGGDIAVLDNGNFVVAIDDRSQIRDAANITTAVVIAPDGSVVKESFVVDKQDIWSNVTSYKGGFAVRVHNIIYFFDNSGTATGKADQSSSGASFDGGRGDGTRIAGHINSPYVYLAGRVTGGNIVKVAAFDSRDQKFVAIGDVSEPGFAGDFDRVTIASDALNRLVVAWVSKPPGYEKEQVAVRVLAFDATKKTIAPITKSFFAFVNNAKAGIRSLGMSVAMTTKEICIAAKGEINLQNKPELGPNSPTQLDFYTVLSHPDPKDDPTPPAGATGGGGGLPQIPLPAAANLKLWLSADKGVTATAGSVSAWQDQSGNLNNAAQTDTTARPQLVDNAVNNKPVIRFDGINDYLIVPHSPSIAIAGDITTFFVVKFDDFATFRAVWAKTLANQPGPNDWYALPNTGIPRAYRGNGIGANGSVDGAAPLTAGEYLIPGFDMVGPTLHHYLNGKPSGEGRITAAIVDAGTRLLIGTRDDLFTKMKGDIAEIIIYDTALSEADRSLVVSYLGNKYGIPVTSSLPQPPLAVSRSGNSITISWPQAATGFTLQSAAALPATAWQAVPGVVNNSVTVVPGAGNTFYRLNKQ